MYKKKFLEKVLAIVLAVNMSVSAWYSPSARFLGHELKCYEK